MSTEPSLNQIDDYNDNESPEKRKLIKLIVIGMVVAGVIFATIKYNFNTVSDYVGTPQNPGINTAR